MQKIKSFAVVIFFGIAVLGLTVEARAALLLVDGNGQLTGATGVNINGTLYDVAFVDGTCIDLFDGCDEVSDFDFPNEAAAGAAAQALMDQVLLDTPQGLFDTNVEDTLGCEQNPLSICIVLVPWDVSGPIPVFGLIVSAVPATNYPSEEYDKPCCIYQIPNSSDTSGPPEDPSIDDPKALVYAVFSSQVTVPEPGTIWLSGVGLAVLGLVGWRQAHRPQIA